MSLTEPNACQMAASSLVLKGSRLSRMVVDQRTGSCGMMAKLLRNFFNEILEKVKIFSQATRTLNRTIVLVNR